MASREPVDAPDGTAARPMAPDSSKTSHSTVGLPRESRISRPIISTIALMVLVFLPNELEPTSVRPLDCRSAGPPERRNAGTPGRRNAGTHKNFDCTVQKQEPTLLFQALAQFQRPCFSAPLFFTMRSMDASDSSSAGM